MSTTPITPAYLTIRQSAEYVSCARSTIYKMIAGRQLKSRKVAGIRRIAVAELDRVFGGR